MMDLDDVLNLEQKFYEEGFQSGQAESTKSSYIEGKEYGLQVSFQKYILLGQIQSIVTLLRSSEEYVMSSQLEQLETMLSQVKMDNEYGNVLESEKLMTKVRNKVRVLLGRMKFGLQELDRLSKEVGGIEDVEKKGPSIAGLNDDGMW